MKLLEKIRSRGYWEVIVRPSTFLQTKLSDINSLLPILEKSRVSLRGWDFPHLDQHQQTQIDLDWIGQEVEWEHHLSVWRFYQSGLFVHISAMPIDWRDQSHWWPADANWRPGMLLGAGDTLFTFTEIFEFAARLSLTEAGDDSMHVEIKAGNIKNRTLYMDDPRKWGFSHSYTASLVEFPIAQDLIRAELVAKPADYAVEVANQLFKRFGWQTTIEILKSFQQDALRR